jgi:O-antigen ligase
MRTLAFRLSLVLIFTIPWETVIEHPTLGSASRLIGVAAAMCWVLAVVTSGRIRRPGVFHAATAAFVVWNGITIFWTGSADRTIEHLATWTQLFVMTLMFWDLYTTRSSIHAGLQMFVLGGYVIAASTLVSYLSGAAFYANRYTAAGTSPDDVGAVLALAMPAAWFLAMSRPSPAGGWLLRSLNYLYIPAAFMGIALSATRAALIAALPATIFGLGSMWRLKATSRLGLVVASVIAVLALLPLVPEASLQRLGSTGTEMSGGDLNGRLQLWSEGLESFAEHPVLGIGSNMYRSVNTEGKVAHNSFISVLIELGSVGFLVFAIVLALAASACWRHPAWERGLWVSLLATWAVSAMTLTWEYRKPTWLVFGLVVASAAVARRERADARGCANDSVRRAPVAAGPGRICSSRA